MKYAIIFTSVLILANLLSCKKKSVKETAIYLSVYIKVQNAQGQDLLGPQTTGYFKPEQLKIYYLVNGEEKLYDRPNLNISRGFTIFNASTYGCYLMNVFVNNANAENEPTTTYIDWGNGDRDTIVAAIDKRENYQMITNAWYNGEELSNEKESGFLFQVFK